MPAGSSPTSFNRRSRYQATFKARYNNEWMIEWYGWISVQPTSVAGSLA